MRSAGLQLRVAAAAAVAIVVAVAALGIAVLARLDAQGALDGSHGSNGDSAKAVALRLGRAIDELELLLREVQPNGA